MKVTPARIPDLLVIEPRVFGDPRGFFMETWQGARYAEHGVPDRFVQDNLSSSSRGVLRGLHLQHPHAQGKLVQVLQGRVLDVAVDVRVGSPWFGQWAGVVLDDQSRNQFWVPAGFAHGYSVISEQALFSYKCTDYYHQETELSVLWNDPDIGVDWQLDQKPLLSDKDRSGLRLSEIPRDRLPVYEK